MKWSQQIQALSLATILAGSLAGCAGSSTQESTGTYIDDTVITAKVKSALLNAKNIKSTEISVETYKGRVQLSGFISSRADAQRAVELTRAIKGVHSVENDMRIK